MIDQYRKRHPGCGLKKMYYQLKITEIGRDKFIMIGKELGYGFKPVINRIKTTISGSYRFSNLIEGMLLIDIDRVWQTDITYYRIKDYFCYITFIIDVYSRRILSYYVSKTLSAKANIITLKGAFQARFNKIQNRLIHHSDAGSQFIAKDYLKLLLQYECTPSMGQKAEDNAYVERLNGIIKNEYLHYRPIETFDDLKKWVKQAVDQYNNERIHDALPGKISPIEFEKKMIYLDCQKRPMVIIYADGNKTIRLASSQLYSLPEKALQAHICPIEINNYQLKGLNFF